MGARSAPLRRFKRIPRRETNNNGRGKPCYGMDEGNLATEGAGGPCSSPLQYFNFLLGRDILLSL